VIRVYHGGLLDRSSGSLWASPDSAYAAAFAQLYEGALWMLTLDVDEDEVLDLTGCGLDVAAVATDLSFAKIPASAQADDERKTHTDYFVVSRSMRFARLAIASFGSATGSIGELGNVVRSRC
jgi:hypothetical protein